LKVKDQSKVKTEEANGHRKRGEYSIWQDVNYHSTNYKTESMFSRNIKVSNRNISFVSNWYKIFFYVANTDMLTL